MRYRSAVIHFSLMLSLAAPAQADTPNPKALLEGVRHVRRDLDNIRARLLKTTEPNGSVTFEGLMEWSKGKQRLDLLTQSGRVHTNIKAEENLYINFSRLEHDSVELMDERERSHGVFDIRILGLASIPFHDNTLDDYLWVDADLSIDPEQVEVNGIKTWHLSATRASGSRREYWIEEPGFRIHRSSIGDYSIESRYTLAEFPIPTHVKVTRPNGRFHREYELNDVEFNVKIPRERFELAGVGIPVNTPVHDYRISRRVGYWTGVDLSDRPVVADHQKEMADRNVPVTPALPSDVSWGPWPYMISCVFILGVAYYVRRRQA